MMAELISSKSISPALHSSPTRKRTRDSNLVAVAAAAATAAKATYKATYQPITHSTSDYLHASCKTAAALATDEPSTFVAMEASSTSAAEPLSRPRNSIRKNSINGSSSSLSATTKVTTTNGAMNGYTNGGLIANRTEYTVSNLFTARATILAFKLTADQITTTTLLTLPPFVPFPDKKYIYSRFLLYYSHGILFNFLHFR